MWPYQEKRKLFYLTIPLSSLIIGIKRERIGGIEVSIYDMEKSVCDALRNRNKIGIDVSSEILRNYLSRKERNITQLTSYAKSMRIAGILNNYLEIQL